jgi:anti-sigma factor ChrR (cupin superfamily)
MARERRSKSPPYEADHPSNVELAMVAAGVLDTAKADVIATHICGCASCRTFVRTMEHIGGVILNGLPPTPLADKLFTGVMARLDSGTNGKQNHPESPFPELCRRLGDEVD